MARSQESFGKKEREKKKQKKKLEKEKKKEHREKQSLDDMIAYVDEHGNITSTPPDPTKKKEEVKLEDIEISVSRKEDMDPEDLIRKGVVSYFNENKGYGFIRDLDTQESIFVHLNGMVDQVRERDTVTFETEKGPKGLNAIQVKLYVKEKPKAVSEEAPKAAPEAEDKTAPEAKSPSEPEKPAEDKEQASE